MQLPSAPSDSGNRRPAPGALRGLLQRLQNDTCFYSDGFVSCVDFADAVHAGQRKHHLSTAVVGNRTAAQARIAALRHDGDALFVTQAHHGGHLSGCRRPHDQRRLATVSVAPVAEIAGHPLWVADDSSRSDYGFESMPQGVGVHGNSVWKKTGGCSWHAVQRVHLPSRRKPNPASRAEPTPTGIRQCSCRSSLCLRPKPGSRAEPTPTGIHRCFCRSWLCLRPATDSAANTPGIR